MRLLLFAFVARTILSVRSVDRAAHSIPYQRQQSVRNLALTFSILGSKIILRMYICLKCNTLVDQAKKRWWSGWRRCPNGHVLYVRILGPSIERSFHTSFLRAIARAMIIFFLFVLTFALAPEQQARLSAPYVGEAVTIYYLLAGLILLIRAHRWTRRAGAAQRLVPHAKGRSYGYLAAVACQLAIILVLLFAI